MSLRKIAAASVLSLALSAGSAPLVLAQTPAAPPADALTDPSFKGPEVVKFMGLKPGDKVADIWPGALSASSASRSDRRAMSMPMNRPKS